MSFSRKIKDELLVKSARCCCVCRRFRGIGVEVHHIIPKDKGGDDSIENGIVLCFDCHCAAGHYNSRHPRGIKFSPEELRKTRDVWYIKVEEAGIQPLDNEYTGYLSRHLVCLNYINAEDVVEMQKDNIPFSFDYLMDNPVLSYMKKLFLEESDALRGSFCGKVSYASWNDFHIKNPDFNQKESRCIVDQDIGNGKIIDSKLLRKIVDDGFPSSRLGRLSVDNDDCGGSGDEVYCEAITIQFQFVFAELKNTSSIPFRLLELASKSDLQISNVQRSDHLDTQKIKTIPYDNLQLNAGESVLIPQGILLREQNDPDSPLMNNRDILEVARVDKTEHIEELFYGLCDMSNDFFYLSPFIKIEGFSLAVGNEIKRVSIHSFDPSKCYWIDHAWCCGSCPHLYLLNNSTGWEYWDELFSHQIGSDIAVDKIFLSSEILKIRIVETDYETSYLEKILFNDKNLITEPVVLNREDFIEFEIGESGLLTVIGKYRAPIMKPTSPLQIRQNKRLRLRYENTSKIRCFHHIEEKPKELDIAD